MAKKSTAEIAEELEELYFVINMARARAEKLQQDIQSAEVNISGHNDSNQMTADRISSHLRLAGKTTRLAYFGLVRASDAPDPFPERFCEKCHQPLP